jgi:hypothetical protein
MRAGASNLPHRHHHHRDEIRNDVDMCRIAVCKEVDTGGARANRTDRPWIVRASYGALHGQVSSTHTVHAKDSSRATWVMRSQPSDLIIRYRNRYESTSCGRLVVCSMEPIDRRRFINGDDVIYTAQVGNNKFHGIDTHQR